MLWTSIATGKRPFRHGIHDFSEPPPRWAVGPTGDQSVADLEGALEHLEPARSQVHRDRLVAQPSGGTDQRRHGVGLFHKATRNLDQGWPMPQSTVYPPRLRDILAEVRLNPRELVEPMLTLFVPLLEKVAQANDGRFSGLCKTIRGMRDDPQRGYMADRERAVGFFRRLL